MENSDKLFKKFSKDVKRLQNQIEHVRLYNIRNYVMKALIKSGIVVDYALPFIIATIMIANFQISTGNAPFRVDKVNKKAKIETIDTSSGFHIENISYDYYYDDEILEHSTGWIINDNGLYERTVTSYRLNDQIDLSNIEKVLSMSKEEIEKILIVTNIKTIRQSSLNPEDYIYDSEALVIINHADSENDFITRNETPTENVINSLLFIIESLFFGSSFRVIEQRFVKIYIRDRLKECEPIFKLINNEELENMKKILEIKKQNLSMIDASVENVNHDNGHNFVLRRTPREMR